MFKCTVCSYKSSKWIGKCPECQNWNSFEEIIESNGPKKSKTKGVIKTTLNLIEGGQTGTEKKLFESNELNNVLGNGLTSGSLILLSGEPGIGKSTLALQMANWYSNENNESLYISSEENIEQLSQRAKRLGINNPNIYILNTSFLEDITETIESSKADLIIIDSISVIASGDLNSTSGSISQIRYITEKLMEVAKTLKKSIVLIGHVTKDGTISGPKMLEHLVDTVLYLEGSRYENYRILRALKNRFGPTDEVGLFTMGEQGLSDLKDPGVEFINKEDSELSGSSLAMTMEGNRPVLIEIEALTTYTKFGYPKRSSRGINSGKLDLLIAIITKFTDVKLDSYDVYINVARGLSIQEPGVDLATIASIISSKKQKSLGKTVFIGEVSLTGIVKNVINLEKRVNEAIRLGFEKVIIPAGIIKLEKLKKGGEIIEIKNIKELEKII